MNWGHSNPSSLSAPSAYRPVVVVAVVGASGQGVPIYAQAATRHSTPRESINKLAAEHFTLELDQIIIIIDIIIIFIGLKLTSAPQVVDTFDLLSIDFLSRTCSDKPNRGPHSSRRHPERTVHSLSSGPLDEGLLARKQQQQRRRQQQQHKDTITHLSQFERQNRLKGSIDWLSNLFFIAILQSELFIPSPLLLPAPRPLTANNMDSKRRIHHKLVGAKRPLFKTDDEFDSLNGRPKWPPLCCCSACQRPYWCRRCAGGWGGAGAEVRKLAVPAGGALWAHGGNLIIIDFTQPQLGSSGSRSRSRSTSTSRGATRNLSRRSSGPLLLGPAEMERTRRPPLSAFLDV